MNQHIDTSAIIKMMNNTLSSLQADSLLAELSDSDSDDSASLFDLTVLHDRFIAELPTTFRRNKAVSNRTTTTEDPIVAQLNGSSITTEHLEGNGGSVGANKQTEKPLKSQGKDSTVTDSGGNGTALTQLLDLLAQQGELISRQQRSIDQLQQRLDRLAGSGSGEGSRVDKAASGLEGKENVRSTQAVLATRLDRLEASFTNELKGKVDQRVLRELMRHIVTKKDMKQQLLAATTVTNTAGNRSTINHNAVDQMVDQRISQSSADIYKRLAALETTIDRAKVKNSSTTAEPVEPSSIDHYGPPPLNSDQNQMAEQLRSEFDDKLMMLQETLAVRLQQRRHSLASNTATTASNLIAGKSPTLPLDFADISTAVWRWTTGSLRYDSIQWTCMVQNSSLNALQWSAEISSVIRVVQGGVYELAMGLFAGSSAMSSAYSRCTLQVLVDGLAVISAVQSPAFIVRHHGNNGSGSGETSGGLVPSNNFTDFLQLPAGSQLSVACTNLKIPAGSPPPTAFLRITRVL